MLMCSAGYEITIRDRWTTNTNRFLHCALHGALLSHPCLLSLLPPQVQVLFSELAMVEEEISRLDRKVEELKLRLYQGRGTYQRMGSAEEAKATESLAVLSGKSVSAQ
ncbi:hypothetical protein Pyn_36787 [Prunus yedoensis var. nudiflora]|uniref:Ternary complex factor MIP1 leucine-zipper domain-containing protein n=1 Tax=Prunus yedoensis var. nudiflora TaxID=2094558 RepID=A0A314Z3R0_PRUYE|nr:hypothetical protein Pyn_36787 [Prunus yedoensis var. nudiflora]